MKIVVSLLLLWTTIATTGPHITKENRLLSSLMRQKFSQQFHFPETQNVDIGTIENCVQDYSPCTCFADPNIYVTCTNIPVETVRDVFQRVNDSEIYFVNLNLLPADDTSKIVFLPADLLGDTSVTNAIHILGNSLPYASLVIDPLAFRASQNSLTGLFAFFFWDFGLQKDFSFLNGFKKLQDISMYNLLNMTAFQHLPPLPSLRILNIDSCSGLINFPNLGPAKLDKLIMFSCSLNDEMADEIVAKLIDTSTESLIELNLFNNYLTRIPNQLGSPFAFPKLELLNLSRNRIKAIENGTFQGNFSSVRAVWLYDNELAVFEEGVFKEILQQIVLTPDGYLDVRGNPMPCGCDIAWLIRDHRNLLPAVGGYCGIYSPFPNVSFNDLDPNFFITFCPPSSMDS